MFSQIVTIAYWPLLQRRTAKVTTFSDEFTWRIVLQCYRLS